MASNLLEKQYQCLVSQQKIQSDAAQIKVLGQLQELLNYFSSPSEERSPLKFIQLFPALFQKKVLIKGIYIFGSVGCGKSMLMDLFFEACPIKLKRRVHFHVFMQEVHESTYQWKKENEGDPLPFVAKKIKQSSALLCFDEFHVADIADAMLLSRLFTHLFEQEVVVVLTSNQHPNDLYTGGLQRELFIPFIRLIKKKLTIIELETKEDYRLTDSKATKTVFYVKQKGCENNFLQKKFNELTCYGSMKPINIFVKGRAVDFLNAHTDILLTSFDELCNRPLGAIDYLAIAEKFKIILIADIPLLSPEIRDQCRRFVTLIDTLYEKKVKIICTLDVPVDKLSLEDKDFDFKRTHSRLIEMKSEKYFYGNESAR